MSWSIRKWDLACLFYGICVGVKVWNVLAKQLKVWGYWEGCERAVTRGRGPATATRGGFCLLPFGPEPYTPPCPPRTRPPSRTYPWRRIAWRGRPVAATSNSHRTPPLTPSTPIYCLEAGSQAPAATPSGLAIYKRRDMRRSEKAARWHTKHLIC